MLKKIIIAGVVFAVIGGSVGYYLWNKPVAKMGERDADLTIAATDLATQFDNTKHLGKVIEVKGKIAQIETEHDVINITLETSDPMVAVSCEMEKGAESPSVKMGDEAILRGQCDGKLSDVVLTRCIVVIK